MLTLFRLLELAGIHLLEDEDTMSRREAERIFAQAGRALFAPYTAAQARAAWIALQKKYHEGGSTPNPRWVQTINRAYQVLKSGSETSGQSARDDDTKAEYMVWGWDGRWIIPGFKIEASPNQFSEIVRLGMERMRQGFKRPQSILAQTDRDVLLIYHRGHMMNPPSHYPVHGDIRNDDLVKEWLQGQ